MTGKDGLCIMPPPSDPMAVARKLVSDKMIDTRLTLRWWRGAWMEWRRTHWSEIDESAVKAWLYQRLEHAVYRAHDGNLAPWSPSRRKVADLLEALVAITLLPATVDAPAWTSGRHDAGPIVACANGLLRVADRTLLPHDPSFFNLVSVPFNYDPAALAPIRWLTFLGELWSGDPESAQALREYFGYVLSGRTDQHKIMLIVGPTRSGKGTIGRLITALIGNRHVAGPTLASLGTNFGLSTLLGKPLAVISDARLGNGGGCAVVERLLTISGEDTIDVDRKYREPWTGKLPTRFLILTNELPNFGDASGAIAHRFIVLTMTRSWLGHEDSSLLDELTAELPGILNWALDGLTKLNHRGRLLEPTSSADAVVSMKDTASPVSAFIRDRCEIRPDVEVQIDALWRAWRAWCDDNGHRPGNKQLFGRNLNAVVPQVRVVRPHGQPRRYVGVELR